MKEVRRALYVSDLSDDEYQLGIRLNMPLANAKAIVPDIAHYVHDEKHFKKEFVRLAYQAMQFSPHVALDENYGLFINITGCAHLFGGEQNMLFAFDRFFLKQGFHTQKSIASFPLLAKALAYFSPETIMISQAKNYLKPLPLFALFYEQDVIDALHDLGINTVGDLLKLPRKMLAQRFSIKFIQRIDQLSGSIDIPLNYLKEQPQFIVSEHFTAPINTHEHFIAAAHTLIEKALLKLENYCFALRSLTMVMKAYKKFLRVTLSSSYANNDRKHWCELLALKTKDLNFHDGIDHIKIVLTQFEPAQSIQNDFSNKVPNLSQFSAIADKLRSRLGDQAVFHLCITDKHLPEHGVIKDFLLKKKSDESINNKLPKRPLRLFKTPIPVQVIALLPDNPPAKILWKMRTFNVLHARGPERIEPIWWGENTGLARDYFYIEDEQGIRLWVYSTNEYEKRWFIHGLFA